MAQEVAAAALIATTRSEWECSQLSNYLFYPVYTLGRGDFSFKSIVLCVGFSFCQNSVNIFSLFLWWLR